jgi:sterol desaturase/sphingolipid hydroxylase (fatty acid hydroxylase superfamily)
VIDWLHNLTFFAACAWALAMNVGLFLLSITTGQWLVRRFRNRPVTSAPDPIESAEIWLSIGCVLLNALVAVVGWLLWTHGVIVLRDVISWRILLDVGVLLLAMDFLMYVFHRIAHHRLIFPIVHRTHHRYDRPRPINLFVLNPFEVLGFGALWLIVISLYSCTWIGMILYLAANLAFGTIGHLGVEPFPHWLKRLLILKHLGNSTFHADHHQDEHVNFGFYTDLWDRIFGTLRR